MQESYSLCEAKRCPRKAPDGGRFCPMHKYIADGDTAFVALCRVPKNDEGARALIRVAEKAGAAVRGEKIKVGNKNASKQIQVGHWCLVCHQVVNLQHQGCRCLREVESSRRYREHQIHNWRPCYVEVDHV